MLSRVIPGFAEVQPVHRFACLSGLVTGHTKGQMRCLLYGVRFMFAIKWPP